jgi:hypothetical protein
MLQRFSRQDHPPARLLEQLEEEFCSHLLRSGIADEQPDRQQEWLAETMEYFAARYPGVPRAWLERLRDAAERFWLTPSGARS